MKKELDIINELKNKIASIIPIISADVKKYRISEFPSFSQIKKFKSYIVPDLQIDLRTSKKSIHLVGALVLRWGSAVLIEKIYRLKKFIELSNRSYHPVIISDFLSEYQRKLCRKENVFYIDLCGNVYINLGEIYIEKEADKKRISQKRIERNPFADKASILLKKLIIYKNKLWKIREMANSISLSPGYVSKIARRLDDLDYAIFYSDKGIQLKNAKVLFEDWIRYYDYRKNIENKYFCLAKGPEEILDKLRKLKIPEKVNYALGYHVGAYLVSPLAVFTEVHVYVSDKNSLEYFVDQLKLKPVEKGANFIVLYPYYKHSVFFDKQRVKNLWVTSDIQLYLDLYKYPLRGLEQAEDLYERRLKKVIEAN